MNWNNRQRKNWDRLVDHAKNHECHELSLSRREAIVVADQFIRSCLDPNYTPIPDIRYWLQETDAVRRKVRGRPI